MIKIPGHQFGDQPEKDPQIKPGPGKPCESPDIKHMKAHLK